MREKKISVIVPAYNVDKFIGKCLDSILNQTYRELDIIIIDDGSTDKTGNICDEYKTKDSRIKIIHKENGGLSSARNTGLKYANGDYILFVDGDDWINSELCEKCIKVIEGSGAEVVIFGIIMAYEKREEKMLLPKGYSGNINRNKAMLLLNDDSIGNYACNKIFKRKLFMEEIEFPLGQFFEDISTIYKLIDNTDSIYLLSEYMYYYRQQENSIMHNRTKKRIKDEFNARFEQSLYFKQNYYEAYMSSLPRVVKKALQYELCFFYNYDQNQKTHENANSTIISDISVKLSTPTNILRHIYKNYQRLYKIIGWLYVKAMIK